MLIGLGGVAFVTLAERKILGLSQNRLGPTKTRLWGLVQPISDGVKLFKKKLIFKRGVFLLILGPICVFGLFSLIWAIIYWHGKLFFFKTSGLVLVVALGSLGYAAILVSWSITSSFSKLGMARSILQRLAYELALIGLLLAIFIVFSIPSLKREGHVLTATVLVLWVLLLLMDCNRAPFDLLEGERELIRGFNTEMRRSSFVLLFLGEYGMILALSIILAIITGLGVARMTVIVVILRRRSYPRIRYDSLMAFTWSSVVPLVLLLVVVFFFI